MRCRRTSGAQAGSATMAKCAPACASAPLAASSAAATTGSTAFHAISLAHTSVLPPFAACTAKLAAGLRHSESRSLARAVLKPCAATLALALMTPPGRPCAP